MNKKNIKVIVHPIVLLSITDHYNRIAKDTKKRVVGVLLGNVDRMPDKSEEINVTSSYAVPFDEDGGGEIWYLDHDYHESMYSMCHKVNPKEQVVGWYSSGPKIRPVDMDIHALWEEKKYCERPVFLIVDVQPESVGLPTKAYMVEKMEAGGGGVVGEGAKKFAHVPSEIGAEEAEEVGVEHLLRDIKDTSISATSLEISKKIQGLNALQSRLVQMVQYLQDVLANRLPFNQTILYNIQDIFNLVPTISSDDYVKTINDQSLLIYISSLIRSIIALHNLLLNLKASKHEKEQQQDVKEQDVKVEKKIDDKAT